MIHFSDLKIGQVFYLVEEKPISVIKCKIKSISLKNRDIPKIRIENNDCSFEVEFENICRYAFTDKKLAYYVATKQIFDKTNKYIRELTDGRFDDYYDLDNAIEKQKGLYPHKFI